jgi:hypothetical protein
MILKNIINFIIHIYENIYYLNKDNWFSCMVDSKNVVSYNLVFKWLNNNVGRYNKEWCIIIHHSFIEYKFRKKEDVILFKLTWFIDND